MNLSRNQSVLLELHPRLEALETPIDDPVRKQNAYGWFHTEIKEVDNA